MSAKRILMLTHEFPPFQGGIARYAYQLAAAASENGHTVTVVAPDFGHSCADTDLLKYPFKTVRYHAGAYNPRQLGNVILRALQWLKRDKWDFIHAVDPSYVMALAFAERFNHTPWSATVYGTDILGIRTSLQATMLGVRNMFERPERLFAISQFTKSLLRQHCPAIPEDRIQVTALGVDPFWFKTVKNIEAVMNELQLPTKKKIILTVARLDSRKGHRTVLRALSALEPRLKQDVTYVIVGSGSDQSYINELHELAAKTGCDIRFLSNVSDEQLRALYKASFLYCMPGEPHAEKVEGFGLSYVEAAAQGLPSIGSCLGAVPEVVLDNQTGLLVPPCDDTALASAISSMLQNPYRRAELGNAARQHASTYSWRTCARLTYGDAT